MRSRGAALAAVALAAAALGGCGGAAAAGTAGGTTTATTAPLQYTPTTTTEAPDEDDAPAPAAPACTTSQLRVETIAPVNGTGWVYLQVVVDTDGGVRCALDGYPQVELFGSGPHGDVVIPLRSLREPVTGSSPMGVAPARVDVGPQQGDTSAFFVAVPDRRATGGAACRVADGLAFRLGTAGRWTSEVTFAAASSGPADETGPLDECGRSVAATPFEPPILPDISG